MQRISSSDFDSQIFRCVDDALSTLGRDQKELVRLRLKNRGYIPLKNVARAPVTFQQSLTASLGKSVSAAVISHILENISRTFGIHIATDSDLSLGVETARKVTGGIVYDSKVIRIKKNGSSSLQVESKKSSIQLCFRS